MSSLLWLVPALPVFGFVVLTLIGRRLPPSLAGALGTATVGLAAAIDLCIGVEFLRYPPASGAFTQTLWEWMRVGSFTPTVTLYLDALSLTMTLVVTGVGFLIHLYSIGYMKGDEGFTRFFAHLNLFVAFMLLLVLGRDFLLLYLGWEGVGLCSYLLIGFWYRDPKNGAAARKAFVVTRVGDASMAVALFLIYTRLGTIEILPAIGLAAHAWPVGSGLATAVALLLLGGAVGKSAQLPLQTWLPDAMAGPTPVSALIHAATMVTAGFYLIARTHGLFALAPDAQLAVAWIGAATLLLAGLAALHQRDIKRVLAYSTMSQIGYMFLALGVGAYVEATFHFMTHAFFKALLFLAAGALIHALHHEQDLFRMGGLRKELPGVFLVFVVGAVSLSALPLLTSGFYSKDEILWKVWAADQPALWTLGFAGAFFTALYSFRMVFLAFFGALRTPVHARPGKLMLGPLWVLAVLSTVAGFVETPESLGGIRLLSGFLASALPLGIAPQQEGHGTELLLQLLTFLASAAGIALAYFWFVRRRDAVQQEPGDGLQGQWVRLAASGFGFDWLYERILVGPLSALARVNQRDAVDALFTGLAGALVRLHLLAAKTETGRLRRYAAGLAAGAALALLLGVLSWS